MFEIIKGIIDLLMIYINGFYIIELEIYEGQTILFGELVIGFWFILLCVYLLLRVLGVIGKGD